MFQTDCCELIINSAVSGRFIFSLVKIRTALRWYLGKACKLLLQPVFIPGIRSI